MKLKFLTLIMCALVMSTPSVLLASQDVNNSGSATVDVSASIPSKFTVRLPKTIVLDEKTLSQTYTVNVNGSLTGTEKLTVKPSPTFQLTSEGKSSVTATVTQDKTEWSESDVSTVGIGKIEAKGLTSGEWSGQFIFDIEYTE